MNDAPPPAATLTVPSTVPPAATPVLTSPVEIVAVTKSFPGEHIVSAHESGLFTIGENRVQEAEKKFKELPELAGMNCRLIGHLQSNKARTAMEIFDAIDSVDSLKLAKRLSRIVIEKGESFPVLAQVNTAADPAKSGFDLNDIELLLELADLPGLLVEGLMTIGELTRDESHIRKTFAKLRELRRRNRVIQVRNVNQLLGLRRGGIADHLVPVTQRVDRQAAHKIQILLPIRIEHVHPFAALQHEIGPPIGL